MGYVCVYWMPNRHHVAHHVGATQRVRCDADAHMVGFEPDFLLKQTHSVRFKRTLREGSGSKSGPKGPSPELQK